MRRRPGTWLPVLGAGFVFAGLPASALALGRLQVEKAAVGERTLVLTFDDSVLTPDLGKLQIEGYAIENAVFLDEGESAPEFQPAFLDMTLAGNGRVAEFLPSSGVLVLDAPPGIIPAAGTVVADTAFGGLFRKVVQVEGGPQPGGLGRKWTLLTVDAELPDAVRNADLSFSTRLDLNQALPDAHFSEEVMGYLPDGASGYAEAEYRLTDAQVLFQPSVSGRLRIKDGKVEEFAVRIAGDCEVMADAYGAVHGRGEYELEDELASRPPQVLPLGNGLFLRVRSRPLLKLEADSRGEEFAARAEFRVRNALKSELAYLRGQWRPTAENRMTHSSKAVQELRGTGHLRISLQPRVEFLLAGVHGPSFTVETYARFASAPEAPAPWAKAPGVLPGREERPAGPGFPGALPEPPREAAPVLANRELSLGAEIFMESRTTFTGQPLHRSFLLFSREQSVLSPPREGSLALKEADSGRVLLLPQAFPKADRYLVQQRLGSGPWETVLEAAGPRLRVGGLKPSSAYRFRVIALNAMGAGPAFPPEGLAFATPAVNHPPLAPFALLPDSGAALPEGPAILSWRGGDPDPGARPAYTVLLDTRNPPVAVRAAGLADTSLALSDLKPGTTYWWRVVASDGLDRSEGPVRSFTVFAPVAQAPLVPPVSETRREEARAEGWGAVHPMVALPRGSFRRDDGRLVTVGPLLIGKYEVSQSEYEKAMGRNPSYRLQDSLPVERVTWEEAETFCREIGGRLPTEAEWEYAARAGSASAYYWGAAKASDYAWFRENSDNRTQRVGQKKPNGWGLHDMAGNVFEWVQDWYGDYAPDRLDHPRGPETGVAKVIRGASWYSEGGNLDLGSRYSNRPGFRNFKVGFRCAKDADPAATSAPAPGNLGAALTTPSAVAAKSSPAASGAPAAPSAAVLSAAPAAPAVRAAEAPTAQPRLSPLPTLAR